jgi:hypothetical protein
MSVQQDLDLAGDFADMFSDQPILFGDNILANHNSFTPGQLNPV